MSELKTIGKVVESILNDDPKARDDDRYLYLQIVKWMKPSAEFEPFAFVIMDKSLPTPETVRRARQKVQEQNPYLQASPTVSGMRLLKEEEYKEFAIS